MLHVPQYATNLNESAQDSTSQTTSSLTVLTAPIHPRDVMAWLKQVVRDHKLTHAQIRVATCIATYVNKHGGGNVNNKDHGKAFMSVATIAGDTGLTEKAVYNAINALIDRDHLVRHSSVGGHKANTSRYQLVLHNRPLNMDTPLNGHTENPCPSVQTTSVRAYRQTIDRTLDVTKGPDTEQEVVVPSSSSYPLTHESAALSIGTHADVVDQQP